MGVLERFERRLGGMVEGTFARVFKGAVEPAEVAKAMEREADSQRAVVAAGRVLVPNAYVVELGRSDYQRLSPWAEPLGAELAAMMREHAAERGWQFLGPVRVTLEEHPHLATGVFHLRSEIVEDSSAAAPPPGSPPPSSTPAAPATPATPGATAAGPPASPDGLAPVRRLPGDPRLLIEHAIAGDDVVKLTAPVTTIGRSQDVDLRLSDTGVSRRHAEIRWQGERMVVADLGSTNGTRVNGRRVDQAPLFDHDRLTFGSTAAIYRRDDEEAIQEAIQRRDDEEAGHRRDEG